MRTTNQRGVAMIATLLIMLLVSSLLVAFTAVIMSDQRYRGVDRDRFQAFYAAQAGLEKLTADIGTYFQTNFAPTSTQMQALTTTPPAITGISFTAPAGPNLETSWRSVGSNGYTISFVGDVHNNPAVGSSAPVSSGPYAGLIAELTPYQLDVTAHTSSGGEVHLIRNLETVAIPLFQFGIFSDTDLSFFPGSDFDFGGRIHTNGNLFLASGATLTISDKVTAVGEVIRGYLSNALAITAGPNTHSGVVSMIQSPGTFRPLASNEGSLTGFLASTQNSNWSNLSLTTYNGYIRNGRTGAHALNLPVITAGGSDPDIVRRPASATENTTNATLFGERYFSKVSLRILLSDTAADITNLPTIITGTAPVKLDGDWVTTPPNNGTAYGPVNATHPPIARSMGPVTMTTPTHLLGGDTTANSDVVVNALDPHFIAPTTLTANGTVVLTGCVRATLTTFTGCAVPSNLTTGWIITGTNSLGGSATPIVASTTLGTPNTAASGCPCVNKTITVASTSGFSATTFWLAGSLVTCDYTVVATKTLKNCKGTPATTGPQTITMNYLTPTDTGTIGGYIKIEMQDTAYAWHDVTMEILNLGIAAPNQDGSPCADPNPNAILRIQRLRDNPSNATTCPYGGSKSAYDYWPNTLFDAREALYRDTAPASGNPLLGGVMYYTGLDAKNLEKWFQGTIGTTGSQALNINGYSVYFSDRRNNRNAAGAETGEYGWEDIVNPNTAAGTPNGLLDPGEDVNASGTLDVYGQFPNQGAGAYNDVPATWTAPLNSTARPWIEVTEQQAMVNRAVLFRRALKVFDGGSGNLPVGLAIVTENPAYLQGDWNANQASGFDAAHVGTSLAADAVTVLGNEWNDVNSFDNPYTPHLRLRTTDNYYRIAIIAGKNPSFASPNWMTTTSDFGTDGGVHNFLRMLEEGGTVNYDGSLATFFYSRQANGIYKCCNTVYTAPGREFQFDVDFLTPSLLPPLTPVFRDMNTLGFTQELRPGK